MGDVTQLGIRLSVSQIAAELGMSRNTVAKRIEMLGIRPEGKRAGYAVYRLRDIVAVAGTDAGGGADGSIDPMKLPPSERRAWYQSENERLKVEGEMGRLIPASQVEAEMARVLTIVRRRHATLPDRAERDLRPGTEVIEWLEGEIEDLGNELADALEQADPAEQNDDAVRVGD